MANAREAVIAHIEVKIAGHAVTSLEVIPLKETTNLELALENALASTLKSTAEKVDAMKYWER